MHYALSWLMIVLLLFAGCTPTSALNSHGPGSVVDEFESWWGDAFESFVVEGCLHSISLSTAITVNLCRAYVLETAPTRRLRYAAELTPRVITLDNGDGIYWLAIHQHRDASVGGWTTVPNTHYLWKWVAADVTFGDAAQPAIPSQMTLLSQTQVLGSAVTRIGDHRGDSPLGRGAVNVMAPLFNVNRDCLTDDHAGLQTAINNAAWRGIYRAYAPAPPIRGCYVVESTLWLSYNAVDNPNHPGAIAVALDANMDFFGDKPIYFNAQGGTRTTGTLIKGTGDQPIVRSDSGHNINGARLLTVRNIAFRGEATTQPAVYLEGAAGVTIEYVSIWQSGEGGSGIWLEDYDRATLREIVIEGPRIPTSGNVPTAGGRALWMRGTGTDNSGSLVESFHVRGFDRCFQLGHETPITTLNNNAILFTVNSSTLLNCNIGVWVGDGSSHLVFNSLQNNGMFDTAISLGDAASRITFVGGTINASVVGFHIGRGSTQADNIRIMNMRISNIRSSGIGIKMDNVHTLSGHHIIEGNEFHCTGGLGTAVTLTGLPQGGVFDLNTNANCAAMWGGTHPGGYEFFDRFTISETSTHFGTPYTNVEKLQFREPDPGAKGILQLYEVAANLDFPVVVANTCSTALTIPSVGTTVSNHYPIVLVPDLTTIGLRPVMRAGVDVVSVQLCNERATDSTDPPNASYSATVLRVQ